MAPRPSTLVTLVAVAAVAGCSRLPTLGGRGLAAEGPPVIVVPEPQIAVPVPLGPGESLVDPQKPYYLAPGVAPPAGAVLPPTPSGVATQPLAPGLFDRLAEGGAVSPKFGLPRGPEVENRLPNPLVVPVNNAELAWDQIADVVSDFFPIAREQPVQLLDGVLTEGYLETAPQTGATLFEPQRPDSVGRFNRWEATFQTIRRRAVLNVAPTAQGYAIAVQALKEIEDLPQPLGATAGAASLRNDQALPTGRLTEDFRNRSSGRWLPLGRDEPLEQELLARLYTRLTGQTAAPPLAGFRR